MGMFDHVRFEHTCPECGKHLDSFQSKDGPCALEQIRPWWVDMFYDFCGCGAYVQFLRPWRKKKWLRTVQRGAEHLSQHDKKFSKRDLKRMSP